MLGNFSSAQMLHDNVKFPNHSDAFEVDSNGLKKLCDIFIAHCKTKIKDKISYVSSVSNAASEMEGREYSEWLIAQEWVCCDHLTYFIALAF